MQASDGFSVPCTRFIGTMARDATVAFSTQYEGPRGDAVPLAGACGRTGGEGRLWSIDAVKRTRREIPVRMSDRPAWDNHLIRV